MEEKSCENCNHFCKHYYFNGNRFIYARCGRCTNINVNSFTRRRSNNFTACDKWVSAEAHKTERRENLKYKIENLAQKWNDMLEVIQSDFFDKKE